MIFAALPCRCDRRGLGLSFGGADQARRGNSATAGDQSALQKAPAIVIDVGAGSLGRDAAYCKSRQIVFVAHPCFLLPHSTKPQERVRQPQFACQLIRSG
jgi:hypothetical protein